MRSYAICLISFARFAVLGRVLITDEQDQPMYCPCIRAMNVNLGSCIAAHLGNGQCTIGCAVLLGMLLQSCWICTRRPQLVHSNGTQRLNVNVKPGINATLYEAKAHMCKAVRY
mmetsp:Transcript_59063/g.97728  ORF Transcript_59063/g.97728 Transcript_59063/m.97728 type:complete len:114 (-) Transcript_59063:7-348(-)